MDFKKGLDGVKMNFKKGLLDGGQNGLKKGIGWRAK